MPAPYPEGVQPMPGDSIERLLVKFNYAANGETVSLAPCPFPEGAIPTNTDSIERLLYKALYLYLGGS